MRRYRRVSGQYSEQRGAVLLEALIAILIFSMGILAMVGLQAAAVSAVSEAKYRSDASFLANQIIGVIWAKRGSLSTFACSAGCTTANGNADTQAWVANVQSQLPGITDAANRPRITLGGGNNQVTVQVFWQAPQATAQRNHIAVAYIN